MQNVSAVKRCSVCGEAKPLDAFSPHPRCAQGRRPECRACNNAAQKGRIRVGATCVIPPASCLRCRMVFIARGRRFSCPSQECRLARRRESRTQHEIDCELCGRTVKRTSPRQRWCPSCARAGDAAARKRWEQTPNGRDWVARKRRRRRARRAAVRSEPYSAQEIYERDAWRCGLCGRKINRRARWPHYQSATIDHIIPLADGGDDVPLNVQAAHMICNARKSDGGGGQLRLVG